MEVPEAARRALINVDNRHLHCGSGTAIRRNIHLLASPSRSSEPNGAPRFTAHLRRHCDFRHFWGSAGLGEVGVLALDQGLSQQEGLKLIHIFLRRAPIRRLAHRVHEPVSPRRPCAVEDAHEQRSAVEAGVAGEVKSAKLVARAAVVEAAFGVRNVVKLLARKRIDAKAQEVRFWVHFFQVNLQFFVVALFVALALVTLVNHRTVRRSQLFERHGVHRLQAFAEKNAARVQIDGLASSHVPRQTQRKVVRDGVGAVGNLEPDALGKHCFACFFAHFHDWSCWRCHSSSSSRGGRKKRARQQVATGGSKRLLVAGGCKLKLQNEGGALLGAFSFQGASLVRKVGRLWPQFLPRDHDRAERVVTLGALFVILVPHFRNERHQLPAHRVSLQAFDGERLVPRGIQVVPDRFRLPPVG
mmetsp:Transcript_69614/g.131021  ORF Transcript_69614/g.131021 Transcript_69614/m.131021 type:complete len:415 (-) Transcript_69614:618-1862(-)